MRWRDAEVRIGELLLQVFRVRWHFYRWRLVFGYVVPTRYGRIRLYYLNQNVKITDVGYTDSGWTLALVPPLLKDEPDPPAGAEGLPSSDTDWLS